MPKYKKKNRIEKLKSYQRMLSVKRPLKGLIILINEYFWKSISGPFLTFGFPVLLIGILGWLLGYYVMLGGALTISVFALTLTSMPIAIYEFKSSSLLKRIGATPIKPWLFILIVGWFYVFMMFVSLFWTILACFLLFFPYIKENPSCYVSIATHDITIGYAPNLIQMFNGINWGGFIVSELFTMVIGVACGLMLASIGKSAMFIQIAGVVIMILAMMLSACLFPPYLLRRDGTMTLWWMGYALSPFKSTINMVMESWYYKTPFFFGNDPTTWTEDITVFNSHNSTIFDCSTPYEATPMIFLPGIEIGKSSLICDPWEKGMNWGLPFVWIGIFLSIAISKFKWTTR